MTIVEKIEQIYALIKEISDEDPTVGALLLEGFGITVNTIQAVAEAGKRETVDLTQQVDFVSKALGYDLEQLVSHILNNSLQTETEILSTKVPDAATLEFITSDLDDYEKFLAQTKAADSLDFLKKEI
jgi:uncharacterized protein (DUF2164 family)